MPNRFPLIANSSVNQIQELAAGDNLDLTSSGISSVGNIFSVGVITATSFVGNLTGTASTATASATSFGLSGTPNVAVGVITAVSASFSGNVSIAGTLSYEDVTNVDSIGLVTARNGVNVTGGSVVISSGGLTVSGVTTVAAGSTGSPSVSPTGDNNTGIFFPAADTIAFAEGGIEVARFGSDGVFTIKNGAIAEIDTLTDQATITPDFATSCNFTVTLGGSRTIANPSNLVAGQSGSIFLVQDGSGSKTVSWGSHWDFASGTAPTLTTTANAVDRVDYIVRSSTSIHTVFTANYS